MKKVVIILILFVLAKPFLPVVDYIVNYDYISKVLCENKAKPALHCNGKCHLMKELSKAADENQQKTSDKKQNLKPTGELFLEDLSVFVFDKSILIVRQKNTALYLNFYSYIDTALVFHPPIS
ncbi:hypothetical protein [Flavobacterium sp. 7A]|uniref:hypothetical protein n=1 Tax=Flavobacterium sp. 7A TaxID=2940571 RepID=UPI0022271312|nr:hypothetical protein [Flavobacterium sp. 7A]MCW2118721.1 hypothetical protein [Flavobacterium sp. 7A]